MFYSKNKNSNYNSNYNNKYDNNNNEISELSRETLAQITGVATESLIRTFADFKSENLIAIQANKIIILNEEKLRHLPY